MKKSLKYILSLFLIVQFSNLLFSIDPDELKKKIDKCPLLGNFLKNVYMDNVLIDEPEGLVLIRYHAPQYGVKAYITWTRAKIQQSLKGVNGFVWEYRCKSEFNPFPKKADEIMLNDSAIFLMETVSPSPVIESIIIDGPPIEPFPSNGDLWLSTWADDDNIYSGWGDGKGVAKRENITDCGIAKFSGNLPDIKAEEINFNAPTEIPTANDKPSSLLFFNSRLYGQFHSPLGNPWIGYLAYSDDYGSSWKRVGFYQMWDTLPENYSPWTRDRNSNFRCMFFINMGKNYELNTDGYVYAFGIGTEWQWDGGIYLNRVVKDSVLFYSAYEYLTKVENNLPRWSRSQFDAKPIPGIKSIDQFSSIYHQGVNRFLIFTQREMYDAPNPWGPWTFAGSWAPQLMPVEWQGGYQPGIISKDIGRDFFWFTIAGQNDKPKITYNLNLGKVKMNLRQTFVNEEKSDDDNTIIIYPNPFSDYCRLNIKEDNGVIIIYDIIGNLIKELNFPYVWYPNGEVSSGIYIIKYFKNNNIVPKLLFYQKN